MLLFAVPCTCCKNGRIPVILTATVAISCVCRYVFKRLKFLGSKELSQCVTLFFLALWHGLYSGYFMNFAFEFFVVMFEKQVRLYFIVVLTIAIACSCVFQVFSSVCSR